MLIWLFLGFAIGTLILLFPLRSWVNYAKDREFSESTENLGVIVLMIILAVVSFIISLKFYQCHLRKRKVMITLLSIGIPVMLGIAALSLLMNPDLVNRGSTATEISSQFTIGSYPTEEKIKLLQRKGYTGIISLLHPAVLPFEPSLLEEEEEAAKEYNIELIKAPMLPWIGDNTASLKLIEDIVKSKKGKYYIHCYLGKDRVNVVKNLIARITGDTALQMNITTSNRTFEQMKSFESGEIYKLAPDMYMTPYPTKEEFLAFFLAGKVKTVVNLMDSTVEDNKLWITGERRDLQRGFIAFKNLKVLPGTPKEQIDAIIDSINGLKKPLVVHHWNNSIPESKNFRKIFAKRTGKPALNLATNVPETY
jgi:hypothetical protein